MKFLELKSLFQESSNLVFLGVILKEHFYMTNLLQLSFLIRITTAGSDFVTSSHATLNQITN